MTVIGEAYVEVHSKTDGFEAETEKGVLGAVGGIAKKAAGIFAAGFAAKEVFSFGKDILAEAEEANKGLAQTEAVLKSTGGAANVTAKEIDRLTKAVGDKAAVDDDAVRKGANLLLTFTNVRNEAGKGNDIFNQATSVMTDMAAAMGTDVAGGAIQLGKALNDPVGGITALTRVGVTFTDQQKEQIKAMVEAGDVAGAQKVILAELNKEFGGSAAAQATAADRARVAWGNFKEELGQRLLPVVASVAQFLTSALPVALNVVNTVLGTIASAVDALVGGWQNAHASLGASVGGVEGFFLRLGAAANLLVTWFRDNVLPVLQTVAGFIGDNLGPVLAGVGAVVLAVLVPAFISWAAATAAAAASTVIAAAPIIALGLVIGGLVAAVVYAYEHFQVFRDVVDAVINFVSALISGFVDTAIFLWHTFGDDVVAVVTTAFGIVRSIIEDVVGIVQGVVNLVLAIIRGDWSAAWDAALSIVQNIGGLVLDYLTALPQLMVAALGDVGHLLWDAGLAIMRSLLNGLKAAWGEVTDFVGGIAHKIASLKGPLDYDRRLLVPAGHAIMEGLETAMRRRQAAVEARVRAITAGIAAAGQAGVGSGSTPSTATVPALANEIRQLAAAVADLAAGSGGSNWTINGSDPMAVAAAVERVQNWRAG